jgi:hypothetical protein
VTSAGPSSLTRASCPSSGTMYLKPPVCHYCFIIVKPKQKMKDEPNNKKHLTPRQIINRYRKGVYVDESIEVISSVISSCGQTFDSITVAFPTTLAEKVLENLTTAQLLYERQAAGQPIDDIAIDDYPRLKDILQDLSYPPLWESMYKDKEDNDFMDILNERGWVHKYHVADEQSSKALNCMTSLYRDAIERAGLSSSTFYIVLHFML